MSKIYDNTYIRKIQKEIQDGSFAVKDDLINFLTKNRNLVLNNPFLRQELEDSMIKLNTKSLEEMEKYLLDFYDKSKNMDINSLNLDSVSAFTVDGVDYIKISDDDGDVMVLDDSLEDANFVEQFKQRQNNLASVSTLDANKNKQEIIKDMREDKMEAKLSSSLDVNKRELTPEERKQFAAVMNIPNAENINFLVDPVRNIYINKDTGEVYFVRKNEYGQLEVRKANEVTSETQKEEITAIDANSNENTVTTEMAMEPDFEHMDDSDLVYIYETKFDSLTEQQKNKLKEIIENRKTTQQKNLQNTKSNEKVFIKKLNDVLHTSYNGFVSIIFLSCVVGCFGLCVLLLLLAKLTNI